MNLRTLKRRHDARTLRKAEFTAWYTALLKPDHETEAAFERAWLDSLRTGFGIVTLTTDPTGKPGALLPGAFYD